MTIAGVIVLLVNDHLLKQAWPGFVTGKLSDVAGLVVAPALLALLFWRRADLAATLLTGALFALVKTTETGAEAASQAWTLVAGPSRVLADPTDLLALPALALAWWVRHRTLTTTPSSRARIIATLPLAVLAVTATAAAPPPSSAASVAVQDGRITVFADDHTTWESVDRGATWSRGHSYHEDEDARAGHLEGTPPQAAMCVPYQATRCYRVVPGRFAVEQSDDGSRTWSPSWSLSEDDRERMVRRYGDEFASGAKGLAVHGWRGGHVVVVATGTAGIVLRDEAGTWRRIGWPGEDERASVDLSREILVGIFLAACTLFGAAGAGLRRLGGLYLVSGSAACLSLYFLPGLSGADLPDPLGPLAVLAVPAGSLTCLIVLLAGRARPAPVAVGVLAAPLVYLSVYLPFQGWADGTPGSYWMAVALAVALTGLVLLGALALIRKDARTAATSPE